MLIKQVEDFATRACLGVNGPPNVEALNCLVYVVIKRLQLFLEYRNN
jgi:hypothetical protein